MKVLSLPMALEKPADCRDRSAARYGVCLLKKTGDHCFNVLAILAAWSTAYLASGGM
jgi:hypothetical protein